MSSKENRNDRDWFEEWFDSPLYELLYAERNQGEAETLADLIVKQIPPSEYPKILDLGCGRGRHSISLAQRGYRVTGLDLSEASIHTARKRAEGEGIDDIRFVVGDMREPYPETMDAVVNLFTSFGYFQSDRENRQVLAHIHGMLRPGGRMLIDYLNAERVQSSFVPEDEGEYDGIRYKIHRYVRDQSIHKEILFDEGPSNEKRSYKERVKLYDLSWFKRELESVGLQTIRIFGTYEGDLFDAATSPRLLLLAERP